MTEIDGNQSGGQAPTRKRRTPVFKHLKDAGYEVAEVIVDPDGRQIIKLAGVQSPMEARDAHAVAKGRIEEMVRKAAGGEAA
jgi:hypothetical protein